MSLEKILKHRTDVSEYLIHWTDQKSFWPIIRSGFLVATRAARRIEGEDRGWPTIREGEAVCFSETPIGNYLQSVDSEARYRERQWGIAIPKRAIYLYGGRPVLYGDDSFFQRLDKQDRYLFFPFDYPKPNFTHEREWRVRPNLEINKSIGFQITGEFPNWIFKDEYQKLDRLRYKNREMIEADKIVPFHLPKLTKGEMKKYDWPDFPEFIILVKKEEDKQELKTFIHSVVSQTTDLEKLFHSVYDFQTGNYRNQYFSALNQAKILSLEFVRSKQQLSELWRLEDIDLTETEIQ